MEINIECVHYTMSDETKKFIEEKAERLDNFEKLLEKITLSVSRSSKELYNVSADIHFHWGAHHHISEGEDRDLYKVVELLFDKVIHKVHKEKGKMQSHHKR